MRCVVVAGAPPPADTSHYATVLAEASFVVAADSGADTCIAAGRTPDLVVGDMDSIESATLAHLAASGVEMLRFSANKELSDLDLALQEVVRRGHTQTALLGTLGGREDHLLAALISPAKAPTLFVWIDEVSLQGWFVSAKSISMLDLKGEGSTVSVFATDENTRVSLSGFKYPLDASALAPWSSTGLSNSIVSDPATVRIHSGAAVILSPAHDSHPCARHILPPESVV